MVGASNLPISGDCQSPPIFSKTGNFSRYCRSRSGSHIQLKSSGPMVGEEARRFLGSLFAIVLDYPDRSLGEESVVFHPKGAALRICPNSPPPQPPSASWIHRKEAVLGKNGLAPCNVTSGTSSKPIGHARSELGPLRTIDLQVMRTDLFGQVSKPFSYLSFRSVTCFPWRSKEGWRRL